MRIPGSTSSSAPTIRCCSTNSTPSSLRTTACWTHSGAVETQYRDALLHTLQRQRIRDVFDDQLDFIAEKSPVELRRSAFDSCCEGERILFDLALGDGRGLLAQREGTGQLFPVDFDVERDRPPRRGRSLPLAGESSLGMNDDTSRTVDADDDRVKSVHAHSPCPIRGE